MGNARPVSIYYIIKVERQEGPAFQPRGNVRIKTRDVLVLRWFLHISGFQPPFLGILNATLDGLDIFNFTYSHVFFSVENQR